MSRFNIFKYQRIYDVEMFGSITDFMIVRDVDGELMVADIGGIGDQHIKFFISIPYPDLLVC
jgi:hypothetical protein